MNEQNTNQALRLIRNYLFRATIKDNAKAKINELDRAYDMLTDIRRSVSRERSILRQRIKNNKE